MRSSLSFSMTLAHMQGCRHLDLVHTLLFVVSHTLQLAQQLTEKRESLFRYQIPLLEISIKSYFCAKQLLNRSSYLATPTCGSHIMKLGTDFFNGLFKCKSQVLDLLQSFW